MKKKCKYVCVDGSLEIAAGMVALDILIAFCRVSKPLRYITEKVIEAACWKDAELKAFLMQVVVRPN